MCTAIHFNHYFGRNLDFEHDFGEEIIITPKNYPFHFRNGKNTNAHYALIGMGIIVGNYPLYFDATNEAGLSMAGLNFPGNAYYFEPAENVECISPFELIPWFLTSCSTVSECKKLCQNLRIVNIPFNEQLPLSPLHWIIADKNECIVIESTAEGLGVYDNPYGVLTNNPPMPYHLNNICNYINVTAKEPVNRFAPNTNITAYSRGMGALGLPGDNSSASRFVRAAFTLLNSNCDQTEEAEIVQFFHILNAVYQVDGCTMVGNQYEKTLYSSCCNTEKGIYYYTTYENPQISAVNLHHAELNGDKLICIKLNKKLDIITSL